MATRFPVLIVAQLILLGLRAALLLLALVDLTGCRADCQTALF